MCIRDSESAHRSSFEHFRVKKIDVSNFVTLKIKNPCFDNRTLCKKSMVFERLEKFCPDFCIFEVVPVGAVVLWKLLIWSKESVRGDQTTGRQSHYILESVKIVYVLRGTATFWYRFGPLLEPPSLEQEKRFAFFKKNKSETFAPISCSRLEGTPKSRLPQTQVF